jgi:hypothetical protein
VSTRRTGNEFQRWCAKWLGDRGWVVRNFPVSVVPRKTPAGLVYAGQKLDVWGADMVARKDSGPEDPLLLWVQASCSGGVKKRAAEFQRYFKKPVPGEFFMLFIKTGIGTVNVHLIDVLSGVPSQAGRIISRKWFSLSGWKF